jgi:S-DNA-T family DNA segregation ATPase FtsK/SpoIIIE
MVRFFKGVIREISFWMVVVISLGMVISLATFNTDDPAWTHTTKVAKIHNFCGVVGAWFSDITLYFFGYPAYLLPLVLIQCSWFLFKHGTLMELDAEIVLLRVLGFFVALLMSSGIYTLQMHQLIMLDKLPGNISAGGLVGIHVSQSLAKAFGFNWCNLLMHCLLLAGVTLTTGLSWLRILDWIGGSVLRVIKWIWNFRDILQVCRSSSKDEADQLACTAINSKQTDDNPNVGDGGNILTLSSPSWDWWGKKIRKLWKRQIGKPKPGVGKSIGVSNTCDFIKKKERTAVPNFGLGSLSLNFDRGSKTNTRIEPVFNMLHKQYLWNSDMQQQEQSNSTADSRIDLPELSNIDPNQQVPMVCLSGILPSLDFLNRPIARKVEADHLSSNLREISRQVDKLFKSFGIDSRVISVQSGPVITSIEVESAHEVKISQISNLDKDLARVLSVPMLRIVVAVVNGKSLIGLEIPNQHREIVYLREILETQVFIEYNRHLTLALGMDIQGSPVIVNLEKRPHLLVAGSVRSGKSVAINTILLSLLYRALPSELRLILLDIEMQELSMYQDIPHLLTPVVSNMKDAVKVLRWCIREMDYRYQLMAALKVRNINGFNCKIKDGINSPFWKDDSALMYNSMPLQLLPQIVIVISELADIMMAGAKVEECIVQLAQKARAAGIHLILVTQHPSVDVITGLIKANIPTRVALQLASEVASQNVLDQPGAERLLGCGDILYLPSDTCSPQRVQGAFVDNQEVNRVVEFLRQTGSPNYIEDLIIELGEPNKITEEYS